MLEELPASLAFHFLDVLFHKGFKWFEIETFEGFGLVVVIVDDNLLEGCDVRFLEILVENVFLKSY